MNFNAETQRARRKRRERIFGRGWTAPPELGESQRQEERGRGVACGPKGVVAVREGPAWVTCRLMRANDSSSARQGLVSAGRAGLRGRAGGGGSAGVGGGGGAR